MITIKDWQINKEKWLDRDLTEKALFRPQLQSYLVKIFLFRAVGMAVAEFDLLEIATF